MTAKFGNNAQSTLGSTITSGATSMTVASAASFKDETGATLATPFVIQIDSELLNVTDVVGTTFTIQRAQEGTTAASHTAGATVKAVVSAGGLANLIRLRNVGTAAPTGGVAGDMAYGSGKFWVNDGGTWKSASLLTSALGGKYIAPTGNDTTGDGSIGSPWLTVGKFAATANPGDTLYCRGGTYSVGGSAGAPYVSVTSRSGTPSAPITVQAYPGEVPSFVGPGTGSIKMFMHFRSGVSYWTLDGLTFSGFRPGASGVVYVGDATLSTHHIIVRNCSFTALPGGTSSDQQLYWSAHADDCVAEFNTFIGATVGGDGGTAINIGDEDPGPQRFLVQRNIISHFGDAGCIWVNSPQITGSILHNTFDNSAGTSTHFIRTPDFATLLIRDNAGTHGTNALFPDIYNQDTGGTLTQDHNFWGQTFGSDHKLLPGNTGIKAASDGTDAGALNT